LGNFFRGIVVFTFLISIPAAAVFWNKMPVGIRNTLALVRSNIIGEERSGVNGEEKWGEEKQQDPQQESLFLRQNSPNDSLATTSGVVPAGKKGMWPLPPSEGNETSPTPPSSIRLVSGVQENAPFSSSPLSNSSSILSNFPSTMKTEVSAEQTEVAQIENELKNLGATYYRLENWGNSGTFYRFSCFASPQSGNHQFRQHFQAIESSPVSAMQKVRDDIVAWQQKEGKK